MRLIRFYFVVFVVTSPLFAQEAIWEKIGHYDVGRLEKILTSEAEIFNSGAPEYSKPTSGVTLYRVVYSSVIPEKDNARIMASGLVAIPDAQGDKNTPRALPVVFYQHGTVFGKEDVAPSDTLSLGI